MNEKKKQTRRRFIVIKDAGNDGKTRGNNTHPKVEYTVSSSAGQLANHLFVGICVLECKEFNAESSGLP
jgi:hypothetical protein